ncbi:MAG: hypothetical protein V9F03_07070 [Microthrixaceae bacterium]
MTDRIGALVAVKEVDRLFLFIAVKLFDLGVRLDAKTGSDAVTVNGELGTGHYLVRALPASFTTASCYEIEGRRPYSPGTCAAVRPLRTGLNSWRPARGLDEAHESS